jgi:hypothetical protein
MHVAAAAIAAFVVAVDAVNVMAQPALEASQALAEVRDAARKDKKAFVASVLKLTDAEAARFWPVYESYQRSIDANTRRLTRMVEDVVSVGNRTTDAYAKNLAAEMREAHDEEVRDWKRMQQSTMRALPASKAVRYLQIENKLRAIRDFEHASALPILK